MKNTEVLKTLDAPVTKAYTQIDPPPLFGLHGVGASISNYSDTSMSVTFYHATENDTDATTILIPPYTAYENNFRVFRGVMVLNGVNYNLHIKEPLR